ncbi:MAG: ImmA/IrrE family metallo-endopeptidase [Lachnospiraceae bacterium]|nr:ImmA/IrrE family metallo-endopeptidase [Lachnospiraceae bacterium]
MTKENIILYARLLRNIFETTDAIEIARQLRYEVLFVEADIRSLKANTYRCENGTKTIFINNKYDDTSRTILCAHELGHAVFNHKYKHNYKDKNLKNEYEVNLFAVALLFDECFNIPLVQMSNYALQSILDLNINLLP